MKNHVKFQNKEQRKNTALHILNISQNMFMPRIHIINSGTWLYFYLSLHVARPFTNANFGIPGASEMVPMTIVSKSSVDGSADVDMQTSTYMLEGQGVLECVKYC
jgi:hypothetical protein